jgi:hypothetical protein
LQRKLVSVLQHRLVPCKYYSFILILLFLKIGPLCTELLVENEIRHPSLGYKELSSRQTGSSDSKTQNRMPLSIKDVAVVQASE